jgi:hypothetical protein
LLAQKAAFGHWLGQQKPKEKRRRAPKQYDFSAWKISEKY